MWNEKGPSQPDYMEKHNKKISVVGRREEEKYVGKTKTVARPEHYYVSFDWAIL